MANSSLPPEFSYVLELAKPPTLEEELDMETSIRQLLATDDINELKSAIDAIYRQNYQQSVFISHSLDKIHHLTAKIACIENKVVQPKPPWWSELFRWKP